MHDHAPARAPGAPPELTIGVTRRPPHTVVTVAGDVDLSSVASLRTHLHDLVVTGEVRLLVDLSAVTFMDSAGLGALVGLYKQVRLFRGSLMLVAPSRQVRRILEITALDRVFTIGESLDDALVG